jgi:SET domain-containing protein
MLPRLNCVSTNELQSYAARGRFYMMQLTRSEVIDATTRGGVLRFVNHSCDPNCSVEKWNVAGEERCGIFTAKAVSAGDELTFDYCFDRSANSVRPLDRCLRYAHCRNTTVRELTQSSSSPTG